MRGPSYSLSGNHLRMAGELLSIVVKTVMRPTALERFIRSVRTYCSGAQLVVVDECLAHGVSPVKPSSMLPNDIYVIAPSGVGLSEGRNIGVRLSQRPYVLLCDDDFCFTKETRVDVLLDRLTSAAVDVCGGRVLDFGYAHRMYVGNYRMADSILRLELIPLSVDRPSVSCDFLPNFFIARRSLLMEHPWDPDIPLHREHDDFFLRLKGAGAKVEYRFDVSIAHYPAATSEYLALRNETALYEQRFNEKWGIRAREVSGAVFSPLGNLIRILGSLANGRARTSLLDRLRRQVGK